MASERFDRQLRLWGEAGQILIEECIVILDGIDGVNEEIAMSLCATGIKGLVVYYPDDHCGCGSYVESCSATCLPTTTTKSHGVNQNRTNQNGPDQNGGRQHSSFAERMGLGNALEYFRRLNPNVKVTAGHVLPEWVVQEASTNIGVQIVLVSSGAPLPDLFLTDPVRRRLALIVTVRTSPVVSAVKFDQVRPKLILHTHSNRPPFSMRHMAAEPEIIALLDKFMTTSGIPNRVSADEVCRDGAPDGAPVDVVSEGPVRAPWLLILLHIARKYNLTVNSTEGEQESINKFANAELERLSHSVDPRCRKAAKINKFWLTQEVAAEQLCGMLQTKKNRKLWNEELGGLDSQLLSVLHIFTEIGRLPYGGLLPENHDCDRDIYVELNETIAALVKRDFERLESLTPASAIPFVKKSWKYLRDQGYGGLGTVRLSLNSTDPTSSTNRTSSTDPTSSTDRTSSTDPMSSNDRTSSTDRPPLSDLASSLHAVMKDIDFRGDTSDAVIINDHPNHELSHVLTTVPPPSLKGAVILGLAMMNDPQLIVPRQGVLQQIVLGSDQARTDCRQRSTPGQTSERERGFTLGLVEYEAALRHACLEVCEEAKIDHCVVDWAVERATLDVTKMDPVLQPTQSGILGGLVTTEILKSITRQFTPFHGTLVFDPFTTHTLMIPYV